MAIDYTDSGSRLQATLEAGFWLIDRAVEGAIEKHEADFKRWMTAEHPIWTEDYLPPEDPNDDIWRRMHAAMQNQPPPHEWSTLSTSEQYMMQQQMAAQQMAVKQQAGFGIYSHQLGLAGLFGQRICHNCHQLY